MTALGQRACSLPLTCLGFLLLAASCASTKKATISVDENHPEIEQLLLIPIRQGHAGVDQVVRNLRRHYSVDDATSLSARTNASRSITLGDGSKTGEQSAISILKICALPLFSA